MARRMHRRRHRSVKRTVSRRTGKRGHLKMSLKRGGFHLTKWAFTNKPAASQTARNLRKHPRIAATKIASKVFKGRKFFFVYVRLK